MKLVIATRNAHKLEEIRAIFNFQGLEVSSAFDYPHIPDVVEDGVVEQVGLLGDQPDLPKIGYGKVIVPGVEFKLHPLHLLHLRPTARSRRCRPT